MHAEGFEQKKTRSLSHLEEAVAKLRKQQIELRRS